jgi:hypothetical protein
VSSIRECQANATRRAKCLSQDNLSIVNAIVVSGQRFS